MTSDEHEKIYDLLKFYKERNTILHIQMAQERFWYNGTVVSLPESKDKVVFKDNKFGEILIYFDRILLGGIMPYENKGEGI